MMEWYTLLGYVLNALLLFICYTGFLSAHLAALKKIFLFLCILFFVIFISPLGQITTFLLLFIN